MNLPKEQIKQICTILIFLAASWSTSSCQSHQLGDSWIRPQDGMVMVYVPAGEFQMGSSKEMMSAAKDMCNQAMGEPAPGICTYNTFMDEYPDHPVELTDF